MGEAVDGVPGKIDIYQIFWGFTSKSGVHLQVHNGLPPHPEMALPL